MGQIKVSIDDIYNNLLLTAISRKRNFPKLVKEADKETNSYFTEHKGSYFPDGFVGLYFTELLSRKMGSSLGEVYNLSDVRKEEIIHSMIDSFNPISEAYSVCYYEDEAGIIEFSGRFRVLDITEENEVLLYYENILNHDFSDEHNLYTNYDVRFRKESNADRDTPEIWYSITITGMCDFTSAYISDSYEVWSGKDGVFAEFIEKVIMEYENTHNERKRLKDGDDITETSTAGFNSVVEIEKPVIESETLKGPKIIEELVTCVWSDTRTVDLLDEFEGYGQTDSTRYRRIVIKNKEYTRYSNKYRPGFNLVIERGHGFDYVGNVTFTEFKKGEASELAHYVDTEVNDEIIEQYVDKDQFYRFSKPYLLRAQNSSNRTGYGWEWDWSGGYGDYIEGTQYGETTNYFFVGVYITTGLFYEPSRRKPFVEK